MEYKLLIVGFLFFGLAYLLYKTRKSSNLDPKNEHYKSGRKIRYWSLITASIIAGVFFIIKSL
jgi:hypothetical protein